MSLVGERELLVAELEQAEAARQNGLEGRARVCSRRAAAISIRAFLRTRGFKEIPGNALTQIELLSTIPDIPA